MLLRATAVWFGLVVLASLNGAFREAVMVPLVGDSWAQPVSSILLCGIILLVTWFTFLPSFVFILAGGPVLESTHSEVRLTAPLTAITAAIVGVIVNLALFFAYHALWPQGFGSGIDIFSASLMVATGVALFRFRLGVIPVIAACALAGLLTVWLAG